MDRNNKLNQIIYYFAFYYFFWSEKDAVVSQSVESPWDKSGGALADEWNKGSLVDSEVTLLNIL